MISSIFLIKTRPPHFTNTHAFIVHPFSLPPSQRAWLRELEIEIAAFDLVREQRKGTTELLGATQLLKLLAKCHDLNLPHKRKTPQDATSRPRDKGLTGSDQVSARFLQRSNRPLPRSSSSVAPSPIAASAVLAARMATQNAASHFNIEA
jgi:hypothetical protein